MTKLRTRDEQEIGVMFLTDKGWSKSEVARALGYTQSTGLIEALKRNGIPTERANRLSELVVLVEENPNLKRPGTNVWPIDKPLPVGRAPDVAPRTAHDEPVLPAKREQPEPEEPCYNSRLDLLDACRKDAERIRARLQKGLADAPPILRAGMQEAMARAQDLATLLTV